MTLLIVLPSDGVLDQSSQLIRRALDRLLCGRCVVSNRDGLMVFKASFHHTSLVVRGAFVAALVGQMDLHSHDVIAESAQGTLHRATDLSDQGFVTYDIMVGIHLDLHGVLLL